MMRSTRRSKPLWSTPWAWTRKTSPATATLQGDLGAESIDFLDIVFRLERNFGIKIPRGELFPENIADPDMVQDGKLTSKGIEELKSRMPYADLSELRGQPRGGEDQRPVHGRHAGALRGQSKLSA